MSRQTALRAHIRQHVECTVLGAGRLAAPIASTPTNHDHPAVAARSHLDHLPPYSRTSRPSAAQFAATTPLSTERGWPLASFCSSFRISPEAPSLLCCSLCKKSSKDARRQAEVAVFVVATMLCHHGATSLRRCGTQGMVAASSRWRSDMLWHPSASSSESNSSFESSPSEAQTYRGGSSRVLMSGVKRPAFQASWKVFAPNVITRDTADEKNCPYAQIVKR